MHETLFAKLDNAYTLHLLEEMIGINSVVGQEGRLAEYLHNQPRALNLPCEIQQVELGRFNVYARLAGKGPGRRLSFNVHQPNEYVSLEWLDLPPKMYALLAARFLGGE